MWCVFAILAGLLVCMPVEAQGSAAQRCGGCCAHRVMLEHAAAPCCELDRMPAQTAAAVAANHAQVAVWGAVPMSAVTLPVVVISPLRSSLVVSPPLRSPVLRI